MYNLVPAYVLLMLVFGVMLVPLIVMGLASLFFWARRRFFGIAESDTNTTLPVLLERARRRGESSVSNG